MNNITFSGKCAWDASCDSVSFQVNINGKDRRCLISIEALKDNFGYVSGSDPVDAYKNNRSAINDMAESIVNKGIISNGEFLIKSEYAQNYLG
jgi:hypothetical protein